MIDHAPPLVTAAWLAEHASEVRIVDSRWSAKGPPAATTFRAGHLPGAAFVDLNQNSGHYLVGTDGCHLYSANSFHLDLAQSIIVPQRRFLSWNGFTNDGEWTVATSPNVTGTPPAAVRIGTARKSSSDFR